MAVRTWLDPRLADPDFLRLVGVGMVLEEEDHAGGEECVPPPSRATLEASAPWEVRIGSVTIHVLYDARVARHEE